MSTESKIPEWQKGTVYFHDGRRKLKKVTEKTDTKEIDFRDPHAFMMNPVPKGTIVECFIMRKKEGLLNKFPKYELRLDDSMKRNNMFLMAGKRNLVSKSSNYWISSDRMHMDTNSSSYLGKVRSNFIGTEFVIYDNGVNPSRQTTGGKRGARRELGAVIYGANIGGNHPREMTVVLPKGEGKDGIEGILDRYKRNDTAVYVLHQKKPKWNEKLKAFTLNFHGRVTKASVKNFQLVYKGNYEDEEAYSSLESGKVSLQFGKKGTDRFTMDVRWPLSIYQAFAICMSSFDPKLACEG